MTAELAAIGERDARNPNVLVEVVGRVGPPYTCGLLGIGNGEAHLLSANCFGESSKVILIFDRLAISGEVLYSKRKGDAYRTAVSLGSDRERERKEPRFPINQVGRITILNAAGTICGLCILTDMSGSGLGLTTLHQADLACMVYVVGDFGLVVGEVRHCRRDDNGRYRIGIKTTGVYANTESSHRPLTFLQKVRWKAAEAILGRSLL